MVEIAAEVRDLEAYVLTNNNKPMEIYEADYLREQIADLQYSGSVDPPRFEKAGLIQGRFKVTCANKFSLDWLIKALPKVNTMNSGTSFKIFKFEQLPKIIKATVYFTRKQKTAPVNLLAKIKTSNPGLHTERWVVLAKCLKPDGLLLTVGLDEDSLKVLKALDYKPYFELGRVTFVISNQSTSSKKASGQSATD